MLQTVIGILLGLSVCVFGIWAFLKGQSTMLDIQSGGRPRLFETPKSDKKQENDLTKQMRALFAEPAAKRGE